MTENRPWGKFEVLLDAPYTKVKRITVNPGGILSYQYHKHRSEHWVIVQGTGTIVLSDTTSQIETGDSVYIIVGTKHRISNQGEEDLIFIEVQTGTYFGEDDIIRIEDKYNR